MNKWVIILVAVALAIGASSGVVFALTADGGGDNPEVPNGTESAGEVLPGLPSDDESLSDFGDGRVVTSIDDIDPYECNLIHNRNACTPEELEELGVASISGSVTVTVGEPDECNLIHNRNACTSQEAREEPADLSSEQKVDRNDSPTSDLTHGSLPPPALSGSPLPSLTFDGVDYVHSGNTELPSGEDTVFVIDGIEIDLGDFEMVGTTYEGNTPGISVGLQVYRSTVTGDANAVYTFRPGQSIVNPEDGQIFEFPAAWTRWTAR